MKIADLAANIVVTCSTIVATLAILDWALTDKQKKKITDKAIDLWVWLEDERSIDYIKKFKNYDQQRRASTQLHVLIATVIGLVGLVELIALGDLHSLAIFAGVVLAAGVNVFWLHPLLLSWITAGESASLYLFKSTLAVLPVTVLMIMFPEWTSGGLFVPGVTTHITYQQIPLVSNFGWGFFAASVSVLLYFWYINIALVGVRSLSFAVFAVGRFILVRIVDSPKGLVLGLSGLAGLIGALFKGFASK
jgi:hypothetical protein